MKALIYGAGLSGRQVYKNIKDEVQVIGFLDGDPDKKGHVIADGLSCLGGAEYLSAIEFDRIYIASRFWKEIKKILTDHGVSEDSIQVDIPLDTVSDIRNTWLYSYAKAYKRWGHINVEGAKKKAFVEVEKDLRAHFMEIFR